jgi:hypothetical protein
LETRPLFERGGPGSAIARVVYLPSFAVGSVWDICSPEAPKLYRQRPAGYVNGETRIFSAREVGLVPPESLSDLVSRIRELSIPLALEVSSRGGLDGVTKGIRLFGDLTQSITLRWWGDGPAEWDRINKVHGEMVELFESIEYRPFNEPSP